MTTTSTAARAGRAQRLVIARAAVARDEHAAAVVGEARHVVGAEAVTGVAARAAREHLSAERAQRRREHGRRRDAVDVVVAEDADRLSPASNAATSRSSALPRIGHPVGRPRVGEAGCEKPRRRARPDAAPRRIRAVSGRTFSSAASARTAASSTRTGSHAAGRINRPDTITRRGRSRS